MSSSTFVHPLHCFTTAIGAIHPNGEGLLCSKGFMYMPVVKQESACMLLKQIQFVDFHC